MENSGYSSYYAFYIYKKRMEDLFNNKKTTLKQKIWAQNHGFYSHNIQNYRLKEENIKDYVSDFDYYRLHPINGPYSHWIDDKLIIRYILHPFSKFLPKYYYHIINGEILRLPDCPKDHGQTIDDLIHLLRSEKKLAAKLFAGSGGAGFVKLSWEDDRFMVNNKQASLDELLHLFQEWLQVYYGGRLITEYIMPNQALSEKNGYNPSSLRVSVIRNRNEDPKIMDAYIRFGTQKTGAIDNQSSGGITCRIDLTNGNYFDGVIYEEHIKKDCKYHPDTKELLEGEIPNWFLIKEKIIEVSQFIPQVIYMGYDIMVTDDGFKIIEINSHQAIAYTQSNTPLLVNERTKDFFLIFLENKEREMAYINSKKPIGKVKQHIFAFSNKIKLSFRKLLKGL